MVPRREISRVERVQPTTCCLQTQKNSLTHVPYLMQKLVFGGRLAAKLVISYGCQSYSVARLSKLLLNCARRMLPAGWESAFNTPA